MNDFSPVATEPELDALSSWQSKVRSNTDIRS